MATTKTPNPEPAPTLAECMALLDTAPLAVLVEIRDALRVMRDPPAAQLVGADPEAGK